MQMKIFLENGESEIDADELIQKAFNKKHEHTHTEEFQDPLMEELLDEFDREIKKKVFIDGFADALSILRTEFNVSK